jgi:hypothetical protein
MPAGRLLVLIAEEEAAAGNLVLVVAPTPLRPPRRPE